MSFRPCAVFVWVCLCFLGKLGYPHALIVSSHRVSGSLQEVFIHLACSHAGLIQATLSLIAVGVKWIPSLLGYWQQYQAITLTTANVSAAIYLVMHLSTLLKTHRCQRYNRTSQKEQIGASVPGWKACGQHKTWHYQQSVDHGGI